MNLRMNSPGVVECAVVSAASGVERALNSRRVKAAAAHARGVAEGVQSPPRESNQAANSSAPASDPLSTGRVAAVIAGAAKARVAVDLPAAIGLEKACGAEVVPGAAVGSGTVVTEAVCAVDASLGIAAESIGGSGEAWLSLGTPESWAAARYPRLVEVVARDGTPATPCPAFRAATDGESAAVVEPGDLGLPASAAAVPGRETIPAPMPSAIASWPIRPMWRAVPDTVPIVLMVDLPLENQETMLRPSVGSQSGISESVKAQRA